MAPRPPWRVVLAGTAVAALGLTALSPVSAFAADTDCESENAVLSQGAVPLPVLERQVGSWIERTRAH